MSGNGTVTIPISSPDPARNNTLPSSDLKVVGEVGAGYLKSKSAISYSSLIGTDLTKLTEGSRPLEFQRSTQRAAEPLTMVPSASADEITKNWSTFVSTVSKSHIAVGTSLTETSILDVHNGMVRVSCPDDYHFSTLKRNKDFLANTLYQVLGKRVAIEPVLGSNTEIPIKSIYTTASSSSGTIKDLDGETVQKSAETNEHPMLTLLKRELGAERVE